MPKNTKNIKIPTFHSFPRTSIIVLNISRTAPGIFNPQYNNAPVKIPINKDKYTSLVFNAKAIATNGGNKEKTVPIKFIFSVLF